jgi:hypothetical protein
MDQSQKIRIEVSRRDIRPPQYSHHIHLNLDVQHSGTYLERDGMEHRMLDLSTKQMRMRGYMLCNKIYITLTKRELKFVASVFL